MSQQTTNTSLAEIEFLVRSPHRVGALDALTDRPRSRAELQEITGASRSTIRRLLREFEARHWITREDHQYEPTELGAFVASGMRELISRMKAERNLRDIWEWLPTEADGFTVEMVADAVITTATVDDPYRPIHRFESLFQETDQFRFVGSDLALLEPSKDEFRQRVLDGMRVEIIDPPAVARHILSTYSDHCTPTLESGNCTIMVHDELPSYGLSLFDQRVGISCYNPTTGTVQAFVDTDSPVVYEWATTTYTSFRREARPVSTELSAK